MILLSVIPAASPTARTSDSSRSVKNPELLRGKATHSAPRGASTCLALGNSSPSTARDEEKTTTTSARLTIFVVTPTPGGSRSSRRPQPQGGSLRGPLDPPLVSLFASSGDPPAP